MKNEPNEFRFIYGSNGKEVGHPYNGGYSLIRIDDKYEGNHYDMAFAIWNAIHNPHNLISPPYHELWTDIRMRKFGYTDEYFDKEFGKCHDIISFTCWGDGND